MSLPVGLTFLSKHLFSVSGLKVTRTASSCEYAVIQKKNFSFYSSVSSERSLRFLKPVSVHSPQRSPSLFIPQMSVWLSEKTITNTLLFGKLQLTFLVELVTNM